MADKTDLWRRVLAGDETVDFLDLAGLIPTDASESFLWEHFGTLPNARSMIDRILELQSENLVGAYITHDPKHRLGQAQIAILAQASWCQGATIAEVWAKWFGTGFSLAPRAEILRPMRPINPALMVQRNQLSDIIRAVAHLNADRDVQILALCANIAVAPETLQFDLPPEGLRDAPPQIAAFLRAHLPHKTERTEREMALIDAWSEVVASDEARDSRRLT